MYAAEKGAFSKLSKVRLEEAKILYKAGKYSGAFYLAGYAVECALKSKIANTLKQYDIPNKGLINKVYIHDLKELMRLTSLSGAFNKAVAKNPQLAVNWDILVGTDGWSEESRYYKTVSKAKAANLIEAIEDPNNGILIWINQN